jgi:hypothetical protein
MSQQIRRILSLIFGFATGLITGNIEQQLRILQRRILRTLALASAGILLVAIGLAYLTTSLARVLDSSLGLVGLALGGLVFLLLGAVILLLARPNK